MATVDREKAAPRRRRLGAIYGWIDERAGITGQLHKGLYEAVPRKGGWAYTLGGATLVLILLQLFTGIFLLLDYVPSFDQAWTSLSYLEHSDRFGGWVRGMHLWGAYVLILVVRGPLTARRHQPEPGLPLCEPAGHKGQPAPLEHLGVGAASRWSVHGTMVGDGRARWGRTGP